MAFITCSYYSNILGFTTNINVCLPQDIFNKTGGYSIPAGGFPTLYLLHGLGDDHTIWTRKCAVDRYATTHGIAVVMPFGARSFYTDMVYGSPYYSYVSQELIMTCESLFPLAKDSSKRFIGGLSMGGYGALKIALSNPAKYKGAFSLSGPLDVTKIADYNSIIDLSNDAKLVFGDTAVLEEAPHNVFKLASEASTLHTKPNLYLCCGTEDFLFADNEAFKKHLDTLDYEAVYHTGPGTHDFYYWDNEVQLAFGWIHDQCNAEKSNENL